MRQQNNLACLQISPLPDIPDLQVRGPGRKKNVLHPGMATCRECEAWESNSQMFCWLWHWSLVGLATFGRGGAA